MRAAIIFLFWVCKIVLYREALSRLVIIRVTGKSQQGLEETNKNEEGQTRLSVYAEDLWKNRVIRKEVTEAHYHLFTIFLIPSVLYTERK